LERDSPFVRSSEWHLPWQIVSASDYPAYMAFLRAVEEASSRRIAVER